MFSFVLTKGMAGERAAGCRKGERTLAGSAPH